MITSESLVIGTESLVISYLYSHLHSWHSVAQLLSVLYLQFGISFIDSDLFGSLCTPGAQVDVSQRMFQFLDNSTLDCQ